jgi:flagellar FliL protein
MAEEEQTEESEVKEKKSSSNMLMIIIIVVLVLIIIVGAVVAVLLMSGDEEAVDASAPQVKEKQATSPTRRVENASIDESRSLNDIGVLYPLDTFTVNLKSDAGRRYLKATMSLELSGEELSVELDAKKAVLRDRIIRILSSKTLEEISSKKGKKKVSEQIMNTLNAMITDGKIQGIYFTDFVIQ